MEENQKDMPTVQETPEAPQSEFVPSPKWKRVLAWVLFRAPGLKAGLQWLRAMLLPTAGSAAYPVARYLDGRILLLLAVGLLLCGPAQTLLPRLKTALYSREVPGKAQSAALLAVLFLLWK